MKEREIHKAKLEKEIMRCVGKKQSLDRHIHELQYALEDCLEDHEKICKKKKGKL